MGEYKTLYITKNPNTNFNEYLNNETTNVLLNLNKIFIKGIINLKFNLLFKKISINQLSKKFLYYLMKRIQFAYTNI